MPSLRKKFSSYFRQLSFHNEPREKKHNINENSFITKYLEGQITLKEGPPVIYGKNPTDLPNYEIGEYEYGSNSVIGCYSGPNGGLTTVKRTDKHLQILDGDIDFIDTYEEDIKTTPQKKVNKKIPGKPIDNTTMIIKVAGNEYCVTNKPKRHSRSLSLGSISDIVIEVEKTKIEKTFYHNNNNNCGSMQCKNNKNECDKENVYNRNLVGANVDMVEKKHPDGKVTKTRNDSTKETQQRKPKQTPTNNKITNQRGVDVQNSGHKLSKSKSEGNPFQHKKRGKVVKVDRPVTRESGPTENGSMIPSMDDSRLPNDWNRKSDYVFGISDSLYDRNQVTRLKNGDPIADCFGIIARKDSVIIAVADGVNWGEKASIAAKSAVHGSLHYLNKTIFNDTKPFENLTIKTEASSVCSDSLLDNSPNLISNTREVFICLLRAFNCAHDLILENEGMLTTLTVAVVLPLKQKLEKRYRTETGEEKRTTDTQYVCCVCNVGDTLAYIYSQKYGVRELTKGSHDINCNRDMRDALGALGPVDGINPELSNLTISVTTLQKGDIVMVATDGLTDNFDPNVCKFTVNTADTVKPKTTGSSKSPQRRIGNTQPLIPEHRVPVQRIEAQKPPVKPPRRSKNRESTGGGTVDRGSVKSNSLSDKSSSPSVENVQTDNFTDQTKNLEAENSLQKSEEVKDENIGKTQEVPVKENDKETVDKDKVPVEFENPLVAQFMRENSLDETKINKVVTKKPTVVENKASSLRREVSSQYREETSKTSHKQNIERAKNNSRTVLPSDRSNIPNHSNTGYRFLRSKTTIDMRSSTSKPILRNDDGIPYVSPMQRYELQLLLMEDILRNGISGKDVSCTSAKRLCENLISYTISITSAKRHTLEDQDLYYDNNNGVLVEVSGLEKRVRRKKGLERVQNLPGKLDHVTVAAYNVGNYAY